MSDDAEDPLRYVTRRQLDAYASFRRTHSESATARELGVSQIRVREALVQYERNVLRGSGVRPPPLKQMLRGDVTTRFLVPRALRGGRPSIHQRKVRLDVPAHGAVQVGPASIFAQAAKVRRLVLTGLDPELSPHHGFLRNLQAYAHALDAQLLLVAPAGTSRAKRRTGGYDIADQQAMLIGRDLELRCDLELPRHARHPLDGLQRLSPNRSSIMIHAAVQLESLPRTAESIPRIQVTTGMANTSPLFAIRAGERPPRLGATIVELRPDGRVHVRGVSADRAGDGAFHDLERRIARGRILRGCRAEALVCGDLHHPVVNPVVEDATWGRGGLVDLLAPSHQVLHDISEFLARRSHDVGDHHARFARHVDGKADVRAEMRDLCSFLERARRRRGTIHIVSSNHDQALLTWLRSADHRADPLNAEFYLDCERLVHSRIRKGARGAILPEVLRSLSRSRLTGVDFLSDGTSLLLGGVEHAIHGDRSVDGRRGSIAALEATGIEMTVGHFHRPTIRGGVYVAGMCAERIGYERGPTARAVAHVVTHADGGRQMLMLSGDRFHASDD